MESNVVSVQGAGTLMLGGRFDVTAIGAFRNACRGVLADAAVREIAVDFSQTTFIDSSAMGMLLLLREQAEAAGKSLALTNCSSRVQQVFSMARFNQLFVIR